MNPLVYPSLRHWMRVKVSFIETPVLVASKEVEDKVCT